MEPVNLPSAATNQQAYESVYSTYLLRIWRDGDDGVWRATLKDVRDQSQRNFSSLDTLIDFISAQPNSEL